MTSEVGSLATLIAAIPPEGLADLIAPRVAVDQDNWHEPIPPTPVPVRVETRVVTVAAEDEEEEEYDDCDGCCPGCGGYLSCSCYEPDDRWEEGEDEEDEDSDIEDWARSIWQNAEPSSPNPRRICPCCGSRNDPAESFFPYCSNHCSKHRDD